MEHPQALLSITLPLVVTILLLLITLVIQCRNQQAPTYLAKSTQMRPKRSVVLRAQEIPIQRTRDDVRKDLGEIAATDPTLKEVVSTLSHLTLVAMDNHWACATMSFDTTLSDPELVERFSRASATLPWRYKFDSTFYGVTPLYEDANGAQIE
jgi:hypothetical protein